MATSPKDSSLDLVRRAIVRSIPEVPSQFDDVEAKYIHVPKTHLRALHPDAMLVVGTRGAGKSFWWHLLQKEALRADVLDDKVTVSVGFGERSDEQWPGRDELEELVEGGAKPRLIWKAVVLGQIGDAPHAEHWRERVQWVIDNPGQVAKILRTFDSECVQSGRKHIVLFDALDRAADTRRGNNSLLKGLLELVLELRSYAALRAKVFVRPDAITDPEVRAFTDGSKVVASAVQLDWRSIDLFALLFRYLGNGTDEEAAQAFRRIASGSEDHRAGVWEVPDRLCGSQEEQQRVFTEIAGPYMGTNRRRGKTYTWVPNHLADSLNRVSPRSFLAAVRGAAEYPAVGSYPLHWSGIQEGVRIASRYRVEEIEEDLPWAHRAMEMLSELVVPCAKNKVIEVWRKGQLAEANLPDAPDGLDGMLHELRRMGIMSILQDGRINIPDVYRVGFGLRRRGGMAPGP